MLIGQTSGEQTHHSFRISLFLLIDLANLDLFELATIHPKGKQTLFCDFESIEVVKPKESKELNKTALLAQNELNQLCKSLRRQNLRAV